RGEWPKTSIWPFVGFSKPSSNLTVVDLPEPFGPSRPNTSPGRTSKSTLSTALALARPQKSLNTFVSPRTTTTLSLGCGFRFAGCGAFSSRAVMVWKSWLKLLRRPGCQLRRRFRPSARTFVHRPRGGGLERLQFFADTHQPGAV